MADALQKELPDAPEEFVRRFLIGKSYDMVRRAVPLPRLPSRPRARATDDPRAGSSLEGREQDTTRMALKRSLAWRAANGIDNLDFTKSPIPLRCVRCRAR